MTINHRASGLAHPKSRPRALDKADRDRAWRRRDERESEKVRQRSHGKCELSISGALAGPRCGRKAFEVHHLLGGTGRRGRGVSADAVNKIHLCPECHRLLHNHVIEARKTRAGWRFERAS